MVICSVLVVLSYNQVHALFFLISVFIQIMLLLLVSFDIEFVSFLLVIVYIGAIAILFLFVVMMLDVNIPSTAMNSKSFGILLFFFFILIVLYWFGLSIDLGGPEWFGNKFIAVDFDKTYFYRKVNNKIRKILWVDESGVDSLLANNTEKFLQARHKERALFAVSPDYLDSYFYKDVLNFFSNATSFRDLDIFLKAEFFSDKVFKPVGDEYTVVMSTNKAFSNILWTEVVKYTANYSDLYLAVFDIPSYFINTFSNVGNVFDTFLFTTWEDFVSFDSDLHTISFVLYTYYYVPFFISSFILLVAMIGAISLTLKQKLYVKRQQAVLQNHRNFEKTVRKVR